MTSRAYLPLPSLTSGRAIAALLVAVHHATGAWGALGWLQNIGWLGVSYFFILSGFVLTWAFDPAQPNIRFWSNRIARIYPMHLLCLLISLTAFALFREPLAGFVGTPWGTLANLLLIHDWIPGHVNVRQAWNGVSWSLSAEFFFYLCAPAMIRLTATMSDRSLINVVLVLYVIHLSMAAIYGHPLQAIGDFLIFSPVARIPEFIYGIAAARLVKRGYRVNRSIWFGTVFLVPFALYFDLAYGALNFPLMLDLAVPGFLAFIVLGTFHDLRQAVVPPKGVSWLQKIGDASYSLYMIHALILGAMMGVIKASGLVINSTLLVAAFLILCIPASMIMHRLVELPGQSFIRYLFLRRRTVA